MSLLALIMSRRTLAPEFTCPVAAITQFYWVSIAYLISIGDDIGLHFCMRLWLPNVRVRVCDDDACMYNLRVLLMLFWFNIFDLGSNRVVFLGRWVMGLFVYIFVYRIWADHRANESKYYLSQFLTLFVNVYKVR